jgi:hypothetical protein
MTRAIVIGLLLVAVAVGCSSTTLTSTSPHTQGQGHDASYALATPDRFAVTKTPLVRLTFGTEAGTYPNKEFTKDTVHVCHATISEVEADVVGATSVGQDVLVVCAVEKTPGSDGDYVVGATAPTDGDEETVLLLGPPMTDEMGGEPIYGIYPANTAGPGTPARTTPSPFIMTLDVDPATYARDLTTTSTVPPGH